MAGLVIGATLGFFAFQGGLGRASSQERPPAAAVRPSAEETPEERERRALAIAARGADGELVEAHRSLAGWRLGIDLHHRPVQLGELERDAMRLFREINRTGAAVEHIALAMFTDQLKDVFGNPLADVAIARIELSGDAFRRINWDGFDPRNFPRVAAEFWLHEELQPQLLQRQQSQAGQGQTGGQGGGEGSNGGSSGGGSGGSG